MTVTDTITPAGLVAGTWTIDPSHSEVGFTVRHLMTKVRGQFETFEVGVRPPRAGRRSRPGGQTPSSAECTPHAPLQAARSPTRFASG